MKITKSLLAQIIKEELENLNERRDPTDPTDRLIEVLEEYYSDHLIKLQDAVAAVDEVRNAQKKALEALDNEMRRWDPKVEPNELVRKASNALNDAADASNRIHGINYDESFVLAARKANERNPLQEDERAEADAQLRARYKELSDKVLSGPELTPEENKEYLMIAATLDPYKGAGE